MKCQCNTLTFAADKASIIFSSSGTGRKCLDESTIIPRQ
eukprot:COSAG02_NODE_57_length_43668_cov_118.217196_1_plen_38_part_10